MGAGWVVLLLRAGMTGLKFEIAGCVYESGKNILAGFFLPLQVAAVSACVVEFQFKGLKGHFDLSTFRPFDKS